MIAIDPGASGGIARKLITGEIVVIAMPKTNKDVVDNLALQFTKNPAGYYLETAYIETLVKYTGRNMPSSAMAVYASNWGLIMGALIAYGYKIVEVPPKTWQKALGLGGTQGTSKTEWKNKLKNRAQQLYPQLTKITLSTADALLILNAAQRGLLG